MYLSKSKYCLGVQCDKILWLDKHSPEERIETSNQAVLDNGTEVGECAKNLFGFHIDVNFSENLSSMIDDTEKLLKLEKVVITEASFVYENNFCSVDILKKDGNSYEIYEVKSSTSVHDIYLDDISYQTYVLLGLGYNVKKCSIVHINSNYVRKGNLDLNELFKIEDVTDIVFSKQDEVENKIKEINKYMADEREKDEPLGIHCFEPYECPYFNYCTGHLPKENIFKVKRMRNKDKFKYYDKGVITYEDLLKEDIDDKLKLQIDYELNNREPLIHKDKINDFLSTLSYPLYFLDFETYQEAIPKYDGIRPYQQIPFQYSLHYYEKDNGPLYHKEFLSEPDIDPRRSLAEKLVEDIPMNVCTLAYNMSFEKTVIKNLAYLFPDLKEHLLNIHDNIKDLMIVFKNMDYYDKNMHGSFSIKYVLPALFPDEEELNYQNLEGVHNGSEAMNSFANMGNLSLDEQNVLRNNLLEYCKLDTYAMVKIYDRLKEVTKLKNKVKVLEKN